MKREMKKRKYESAEVEIVLLELSDIVTGSSGIELPTPPSLPDIGDGGWVEFE